MKPGESHSYYTDEEETPTNKLHLKNPKQCESEKPETVDPSLDSYKNMQDQINKLDSETNDDLTFQK